MYSRIAVQRVTVAFAGAIMSTAATVAGAQDTTLTRLLIANRHPIRVVDGRLAGEGGRRLVAQGSAARFVMLGEEHGVAEVPEAMGALLRELRPAGFATLAIEVSPLRGEELDRMARSAPRGVGVKAPLDRMLSSWLTMVPFYSLAEEKSMLQSAMEWQGTLPPMRIWGLDYEVSADRQWLRELVTLVPPSGRAVVSAASDMAEAGFTRMLQRGDPSGLFAWSTPDSVFDALRRALGPRPAARATAIVELLQESARINRMFLAGRTYESNLARSRFLRQNLHRALSRTSRDTLPRVVFKFGGSHLMRGWNYTHTLDLGTTVAVTAEAVGDSSYHVLFLGGTGTKSSRLNPIKGQYEPNGSAEVDLRMLAWLTPALPPAGEWTVFDLRAARTEWLRSGRSTLTPVQDRFVHAWDAIVVFGGSRPGTVIPFGAGEGSPPPE